MATSQLVKFERFYDGKCGHSSGCSNPAVFEEDYCYDHLEMCGQSKPGLAYHIVWRNLPENKKFHAFVMSMIDEQIVKTRISSRGNFVHENAILYQETSKHFII